MGFGRLVFSFKGPTGDQPDVLPMVLTDVATRSTDDKIWVRCFSDNSSSIVLLSQLTTLPAWSGGALTLAYR